MKTYDPSDDDNTERIAAEYHAFRGLPFPKHLGGKEVDGICVTMLDADIAGLVSWVLSPRGRLTEEQLTHLMFLLHDLERVLKHLDGDDLEYFQQLHELGTLAHCEACRRRDRDDREEWLASLPAPPETEQVLCYGGVTLEDGHYFVLGERGVSNNLSGIPSGFDIRFPRASPAVPVDTRWASPDGKEQAWAEVSSTLDARGELLCSVLDFEARVSPDDVDAAVSRLQQLSHPFLKDAMLLFGTCVYNDPKTDAGTAIVDVFALGDAPVVERDQQMELLVTILNGVWWCPEQDITFHQHGATSRVWVEVAAGGAWTLEHR